MGQDMGPSEWCAALAAHFFNEDVAQLPVLFLVDEDVLARIHPSANRQMATESLAAAVRDGLSYPEPHGYFHAFESRGRIWKLGGAKGDPPFLHLLAVCVLAATRMGTGRVAPNNYRSHLCELLGLDDSRMPAGFRDSLYYLWDTLTWWLDEANEGRRGISTVAEDKHFTHIGYPISQTLFRGSDARSLEDFFRWMQLEPGEEVESDVLVAHFRAWAPGQGLSAGAMRLLTESQFEQAISSILGAYARQWDGTRVTRTGARATEMRVTVELSVQPRVSIQGLQPDGYADILHGSISGGLAVTVVATDGVLQLRGEVDPRHLTRGFVTASDGCSARLTRSDVHILRLDPELGGWASVSAFVPGERHCVLVAPGQADDVIRQLERASVEPVHVQSAPARLAAWSLVRNVVVSGEVPLTGLLETRRPTARHRFAFRGGLPLVAKGSYLAGGAPDVWLPPAASEAASLTLDGAALPVTGERVRLSTHLPASEPGTHCVRFAGIVERCFVVVDSARRMPPEVEAVHGHELELEGDDVTAHRAVSSLGDDGVRVVGPHVHGTTDKWKQRPILLRRHAREAWLLGAMPGHVFPVQPPPSSRWLARLSLSDHLYEARAPFVVQYSVERWPSEPFLRLRQRGTTSLVSGEIAEDPQTWCRLLIEATPVGELDAKLLSEYQERAISVSEAT